MLATDTDAKYSIENVQKSSTPIPRLSSLGSYFLEFCLGAYLRGGHV